jgi:hypothetical protein
VPVFLFIVGKFLAYWAYCSFAPRWLGFAEPLYLRFGFIRGLMRLAFGFLGFFVIAFLLQKLDGVGMTGSAVYALAFIPVRFVEWLTLFLIIAQPRRLPFNVRASYWILGGVAVSCLCDGVAIALLDAGIVHLNIC